MSDTFDLAVVGAGVMGCATAAAGAAAGLRTVLLDQHAPGTPRGSSHGASRIIRLAYHDAVYVALARRSYAAWDALEEEAGPPLMVGRAGGLDLADDPDDEALRIREAVLTAAGVPYERLDRDTLARRYPQLRLGDGATAIYQEATRALRADRCLAALLRHARRDGAHLRAPVAVTALAADGAGARLDTSAGPVRAQRVVVAAGAWAPSLLRTAGIELPLAVHAEQVAVLKPRSVEDFATDRFPIIVHHRGCEPLTSIFPTVGTDGVKVMFDHDGPPIDPASDERRVHPERLDDLVAYARTLLPGLTGAVLETTVCLYANTPDEDFVVDVAGADSPFVVLSACSGHGFKFAPVLGAEAVALATGREADLPTGRFALDRRALSPLPLEGPA